MSKPGFSFVIISALAFPSFNFQEKQTPIFGKSKNERLLDYIQQESSGQNHLFWNEMNPKRIEDDRFEDKSGLLGVSQDVKISENLSFTPNDSSDNSDKEFNQMIYNNDSKTNILKKNGARKRYSNQGMTFQR
jgi:hypothetical protein